MIKLSNTTLSFIQVEGNDAEKFLQGQLTCDVRLENGASCLGAHCNPQGRVISLFRLFKLDGKYYLLLLESMSTLALAALKKYAVFFKSQLSIVTDTTLLQQLYQLAQIKDAATFHRTIIEAGIPTIYPETSGKFLPHELNLDQLNAINFEKGCYTGQEIIARMHYRGKLKTRLFKAFFHSKEGLSPGTEIMAANHDPAGVLVDSYQIGYNSYIGLIITNEDQATQNQLQLNDIVFDIQEK